MGLFDKLKAIASSQAAPVPSASSSLPQPSQPTLPRSQEQHLPIARVMTTNTIDNDGDDTWNEIIHNTNNISSASNSTTPNKSNVLTFTENRLHRVDPADLIWAPFYRYKQLFPARRCRPEELVFDPSLQVVSSEGKVVVEFFSQVRVHNTCQRDTVHSEKILPYWAFSENDDEAAADKSCWNRKRVENVRKALFKHKPLSNKNANLILDTAMSTAKTFLDLALTSFIPEEDGDSQDSDKGLDANAPMVLNDSRCDEDEENESNTKDISAFAYREKQDDEDEPIITLADRTLCVGDTIRYHNMVFGKTIRTTIVGFSDDPNHPLLLEDNYMIDLNTFIGKVTTSDPAVIPTTITKKRAREKEDHEEEKVAKTSNKRCKVSKGSLTSKDDGNEKQTNDSSQKDQQQIKRTTAISRLYPLHKFVLFREDSESTTQANSRS